MCNAFTASVTIHYLSYIMGARCRSPRLPGNELRKWGYLSGKQSASLMPNYSLTNTQVGHWGASLPHHPAQYVPICCQGGMERSREVHPPRPLAKPTQAGSQRKLVCCTAGGLLDLPERNPGPVSWGISAKEVTRPAAMQASAERGSYSWHLVLADEPVVEVGGGAALQDEDQCGVTATTYQPFSQPEAQSRSCERKSWHDEALQEAREAHQWVLEAAHRLELDIKRLSQGVGNVQCPHSHSGSCWQRKSLDRWERSPSQCRLERHVTFWEPEVEPYSGKVHTRNPKGTSPKP